MRLEVYGSAFSCPQETVHHCRGVELDPHRECAISFRVRAASTGRARDRLTLHGEGQPLRIMLALGTTGSG
jgi:hypothetical protein